MEDSHEPLPPQRRVIVGNGKRPSRRRGHADEYAVAALRANCQASKLSRATWCRRAVCQASRLRWAGPTPGKNGGSDDALSLYSWALSSGQPELHLHNGLEH